MKNIVKMDNENLIMNGDFEQNFTEWQVEGPSGEQIINSGANKFLRLSSLGRISQEVTITPNKTYTLSFNTQALYVGGKSNVTVGTNDTGNLFDEHYENNQMESREIIFKAGSNDTSLKLTLHCSGGEARFDNIVLAQDVPTVSSAYVYSGGYIAINFSVPLSDQTTFTMYVNGERRRAMTFDIGRKYWRGDVSFWGGTWAEAKDSNTRFTLKTMIGDTEQTLIEFNGVSSHDVAIKEDIAFDPLNYESIKKKGIKMETKAQQLVATVLSQPGPLEGQKNRSSGNFSTESLPSGTKYLRWEIEGGGDPDFISFNVMEDKSAAVDPVHFTGVLSGNRTNVVSKRSLYIANPSNASGPFTVSVYAIF